MSSGVNVPKGSKMRLQESTRILWRAIAGAGPQGIGQPQLLDKVKAHFDNTTIKNRLRSMRETGYTTFIGATRHGVWKITDRVPLGEDIPAWLGTAQRLGMVQTAEAGATASTDDDDDADDFTPAPAPLGVPDAPNSVFAVGEGSVLPAFSALPERRGAPPKAISTFTDLKARMADIKAGKVAPADHGFIKLPVVTAPPPEPMQGKPIAMLTAEAEAEALAEVAFHAEQERAYQAGPAPAAGPTQPPAPRVTLASRPAEPVFELHSDGILVLDLAEGEPEGQVVIPAHVTRSLFRWLTRLSGGDLMALVMEDRS